MLSAVVAENRVVNGSQMVANGRKTVKSKTFEKMFYFYAEYSWSYSYYFLNLRIG